MSARRARGPSRATRGSLCAQASPGLVGGGNGLARGGRIEGRARARPGRAARRGRLGGHLRGRGVAEDREGIRRGHLNRRVRDRVGDRGQRRRCVEFGQLRGLVVVRGGHCRDPSSVTGLGAGGGGGRGGAGRRARRRRRNRRRRGAPRAGRIRGLQDRQVLQLGVLRDEHGDAAERGLAPRGGGRRLVGAVPQRGRPTVVVHIRGQGIDARLAHDLDGLPLGDLDRQVLPGLPAHGDRLGGARGGAAQVERDGTQGARAVHGADGPIHRLVAGRVLDRGADRGDRIVRGLRADGGGGQREDESENGQGREPSGAAVAQGRDREGEADDDQAHAAADDDDARDRLGLRCGRDEGDGGSLVDHVDAGEDGGRDEDQEARDRQVRARGHRAGPVGRRGTRGPLTRLGRARGGPPAGVGLGGAGGGRARPGLCAGGPGGAGGVCRDPVEGVSGGVLGARLPRRRGTRAASGRGGPPKRGGVPRRRGALLAAVLRCPVPRGSVLAGGPRAAPLVRRAGAGHDEIHEADEAADDGEREEGAKSDAGAPEDEAHGGDEGGQGEQAEDNAADNGDVEAALEGLLQVDAAVLGLGQQEPTERVGEGHDGDEERGEDGQHSHEGHVPPGAGGHARADAADDARLRAVPSRAAHGLKEPVAGRALLVVAAGVRRTVRPTHGALPLDGIHDAWIDTTTQPNIGGAPTVGDPLNGP